MPGKWRIFKFGLTHPDVCVCGGEQWETLRQKEGAETAENGEVRTECSHFSVRK